MLAGKKSDAVGDQNIDLKRRHADHAGAEPSEDGADRIISPRRDPLWPKALAPERGQLIKQLRHTGHQHADGECKDLVIQCISPTRRQP